MATLSALKSWPLALGIFLLMLLVTAMAAPLLHGVTEGRYPS